LGRSYKAIFGFSNRVEVHLAPAWPIIFWFRDKIPVPEVSVRADNFSRPFSSYCCVFFYCFRPYLPKDKDQSTPCHHLCIRIVWLLDYWRRIAGLCLAVQFRYLSGSWGQLFHFCGGFVFLYMKLIGELNSRSQGTPSLSFDSDC